MPYDLKRAYCNNAADDYDVAHIEYRMHFIYTGPCPCVLDLQDYGAYYAEVQATTDKSKQLHISPSYYT